MLNPEAMLGIVLLAVALGGGAYASFKNLRGARGPKEKSFVVRVCVLGWLLMLSMPVVLYLLPPPWRYLALAAYLIGVPVLIYRWATIHQLIRIVEGRKHDGGLDEGPART